MTDCSFDKVTRLMRNRPGAMDYTRLISVTRSYDKFSATSPLALLSPPNLGESQTVTLFQLVSSRLFPSNSCIVEGPNLGRTLANWLSNMMATTIAHIVASAHLTWHEKSEIDKACRTCRVNASLHVIHTTQRAIRQSRCKSRRHDQVRVDSDVIYRTTIPYIKRLAKAQRTLISS